MKRQSFAWNSLVFGGRPLLTGGSVVSSPGGQAAVLTSRGAALLSLDLDPTRPDGEGFGFTRACLASLDEVEFKEKEEVENDGASNCGETGGEAMPSRPGRRDRLLPLGVENSAISSGQRVPDPLSDPLRAFSGLARRLPVTESGGRGGGGFVKADWSPFQRFGRGCLAAVSGNGRLVVLSFRRSLLEAETPWVSADLSRMWWRVYVHLGRVVRPELNTELPLVYGHPLLPEIDPAYGESNVEDEEAIIWCDNMSEYAMAAMDMSFVAVSWSAQARPKPWHNILAGVTRSGVLALYAYDPVAPAGICRAKLIHASYALAIGGCGDGGDSVGGSGDGASFSSASLPSAKSLAKFGDQACMLRLCDLQGAEGNSSILALVGRCDGRVLGARLRLFSGSGAESAVAGCEATVAVSCGADWCLWGLADQLQPLDAAWSAAGLFGCVAKGAHLVSFSVAKGGKGGVSASTVTTSFNSLQITGLACVGNCIYYCCLDGRLFCAKFQSPDTTSSTVSSSSSSCSIAANGRVVCSSVSELLLTTEPVEGAVPGPRGKPYYYGLYCSRNAVLLGVLEGRVWLEDKSCGVGAVRLSERSRLTFRLMRASGEDRLVELLRNAERPLSQKLDVLETVRHVYYRDRMTKDNFLRAELDSLAGITRNPDTLLALGSEAHNLQVLRFLLTLAGSQEALETARTTENLMLLRHCSMALRQLCRLASSSEQQLVKQASDRRPPVWRPSQRDLRALACMLDTLRRACDAEPRLLGAARSAWRLDAVMERASRLLPSGPSGASFNVSRACYVCQSELPLPGQQASHLLQCVTCDQGHAFARCCRTLLPVAVSAGFLRCSVCPAYCLGPESPGGASTGTNSSADDWLTSLLSHDICLFCDAPMIPVRNVT